MPEVSEQLRSHAAWIDESAPAFDPDELRQRSAARVEALDERPRRGRRNRRLLLAVAAVALVAVVAAALVVHARSTGPSTGVSTVNQPPSARWLEAPDLAIPTTPTSFIGTHVVAVWTGSEELLVGQLVNAVRSIGPPDGSPSVPQVVEGIPAYNPAFRQWHVIPAPPVGMLADEFAAFWTGSRLLVVGASPYDRTRTLVGAAYDPSSGRWITIGAAPPVTGLTVDAVWTGHELLNWTSGAGVMAYHLATNTWDQLTQSTPPGPPRHEGLDPAVSVSDPGAVWTGREMVVVGWADGSVRGFDPAARSWSKLPSPTELVGGSPVAWTGRYIGLGDPSTQVTWYDSQTGTWQTEQGPAAFANRAPFAASVWFDGELVAIGGGIRGSGSAATSGQALDLATATWYPVTPLPPGSIPVTSAAVAGDDVFVWGVDPNGALASDHATIRAATIASSALAAAPATATTTDAAAAVISVTERTSCSSSGSYVLTWSVSNRGRVPVELQATEFLVPGHAFEPNPLDPGRTATARAELPGTTRTKTFAEVVATPVGRSGLVAHGGASVTLPGTCRPH